MLLLLWYSLRMGAILVFWYHIRESSSPPIYRHTVYTHIMIIIKSFVFSVCGFQFSKVILDNKRELKDYKWENLCYFIFLLTPIPMHGNENLFSLSNDTLCRCLFFVFGMHISIKQHSICLYSNRINIMYYGPNYKCSNVSNTHT